MPTPLGNAVRIAKQNNLKIEVFQRNDGVSVEIEQTAGSGYGTVQISISKSHRKAAKLYALGARSYGSSWSYSTWYFVIHNTPEILEKAKLLGARVTRGKKPRVLFDVSKGKVTEINMLA